MERATIARSCWIYMWCLWKTGVAAFTIYTNNTGICGITVLLPAPLKLHPSLALDHYEAYVLIQASLCT